MYAHILGATAIIFNLKRIFTIECEVIWADSPIFKIPISEGE